MPEPATATVDEWGDDLRSLSELVEMRRPVWMRRAACRDMDTEMFFARGSDVQLALQVCKKCPVRFECVRYARDNGITHGVWGGMSGRGRRRSVRIDDRVRSRS